MTGSEQGTRRRSVTIVGIVALLALVGGAWLFQLLAADEGEASRVLVTRGGAVLATFSMADLREIDAVSFSQAGSRQEGPPVVDVLRAAGVDDFERLTVRGLGVRDDGVIVLERDEVTGDVILDFAAQRESVKIAGPDISWGERVRDVTELQVD